MIDFQALNFLSNSSIIIMSVHLFVKRQVFPSKPLPLPYPHTFHNYYKKNNGLLNHSTVLV